MNTFKLILRLFLTPFLSVMILVLTESNMFLYPLFFSLFISISNYDLHRFGLPIGILLGVFFSYISFFTGYYGYAILYKTIEVIGIPNDISIGKWFYTELAFLLAVLIIAPLITMYLLKLLFKNTKTHLTYQIVLLTTSVLVMISFIHIEQDVNSFFNIMNLWQLIIMFGLQLIINQKVIVEKFMNKNKIN